MTGQRADMFYRNEIKEKADNGSDIRLDDLKKTANLVRNEIMIAT